jgi:hypothetical protein
MNLSPPSENRGVTGLSEGERTWDRGKGPRGFEKDELPGAKQSPRRGERRGRDERLIAYLLGDEILT